MQKIEEITAREEEIQRLREVEGLTYREIAERYGINPSRVSQIYHSILRKRREQQQKEFYESQNRKTVSFELTLGEIVVLQRILVCYMLGESGKIWHTRTNSDQEELENSIDYMTAESLSHRLHVTENQNRERLRDK